MSPKISAGTGQLTSSRQAPVTRPSPPAPARARRLTRRIGETPARAAFVIMIALLAGCSSSAPTSPGATPSSATTIHDGTTYVFTSQNPTVSGNPSADRAAFRTFLAGIQLQR
jgi:hypothetical protein